MSQPHEWVPPAAGAPAPDAATVGGAPRAPGAPGPSVSSGRPGIVPLRPLTLLQVYDGAFRAVRTNPVTMLGFSAVVVLVSTAVLYGGQALVGGSALEDLAAGEVLDPALALRSILGAAPGLLLTLVSTALLSGALVLAVADAVRGRRPGPGELWQRVRGRLVALVGLALLVAAVSTVAAVLCLLPAVVVLVGGATVAGVVLLALGVLAALACVLLLDVRLFMATPALVVEGLGLADAVARSWSLTRSRFWRLLGTRLLAAAAIMVIAGIVSAPFSIPGQLVPVLAPDASGRTLALGVALVAVGQAVASTITQPLTAAVTSLQYLDQRMRLEGLDAALAAGAACA